MAQGSIENVLGVFAELGDQLVVVRDWITNKQRVLVLYTFQAAVQNSVRHVDTGLSDAQATIIDLHKDTSVSSKSLLDDVQRLSRPVPQILSVLLSLQSDNE